MSQTRWEQPHPANERQSRRTAKPQGAQAITKQALTRLRVSCSLKESRSAQAAGVKEVSRNNGQKVPTNSRSRGGRVSRPTRLERLHSCESSRSIVAACSHSDGFAMFAHFEDSHPCRLMPKPLFRPDVVRNHIARFKLPAHVRQFQPKPAEWIKLIFQIRRRVETRTHSN